MTATHPANSITSTNITNWTTAHGWGDHSAAGYMTATHPANNITATNITNWNTAHGWGDHSAAGYLTAEADPTWSGNATTTGAISRTGAVGIGTNAPAGSLHVQTSGGLVIMPGRVVMRATDSFCTLSGCSNNDVMDLRSSGWMSLGRVTPEYPLHMASGAHVTTGGVWTNASSRHLKENIRELSIEEASAAVQELTAVRYHYKIDDAAEEYVGFIAEDVPELVATADRKGLSAMDIVAVLTPVVQSQQSTIEELRTDNEALRARLEAIEALLASAE